MDDTKFYLASRLLSNTEVPNCINGLKNNDSLITWLSSTSKYIIYNGNYAEIPGYTVTDINKAYASKIIMDAQINNADSYEIIDSNKFEQSISKD